MANQTTNIYIHDQMKTLNACVIKKNLRFELFRLMDYFCLSYLDRWTIFFSTLRFFLKNCIEN